LIFNDVYLSVKKDTKNNLHQCLCGTQPGIRLLQMVFVIFLTCSFSIPPQEEPEEYDIKAAFIYKFTNYIDWDSHLQGSEFVIGIIGNSPISNHLTEIAQTKTIKDKKIVIHQFSKADEISVCQILFISRKTSASIDDILSKVANQGTLTISEKPGYAKKGADINFIEVDDKLRFEINTKGINAAGLKASSQLLKLAIIIE
jgi:uncharacterized protein DUF4154